MPQVTPPLFPGLFQDAARRLGAESQATIQPQDAWRQALTDGWASIAVPEADGGSGGTLSDLCALVEGLASQGAVLPVAERCAAAAILLQGAGSDAAARLPALAAGDWRCAVLAPATGSWGQGAPATKASARADGAWALTGEPFQCSGIGELDAALLVAGDDDGVPILLLLPPQALAGVRDWSAADGQAVRRLVLPATVAGEVLARGDAVIGAAMRADDVTRLLVCTDSIGALGALLDQTVAHLEQRVQFGSSLSSFQALRHRTVDLRMALEAGRGLLARNVRLMEASEPMAGRELALTKLYLGTAGRAAAESAIQLHGAIGMSEELPAARLARRIVVNDFRMGDRLLHDASLRAGLARQIEGVWA